jgi:hypothetical protein
MKKRLKNCLYTFIILFLVITCKNNPIINIENNSKINLQNNIDSSYCDGTIVYSYNKSKKVGSFDSIALIYISYVDDIKNMYIIINKKVYYLKLEGLRDDKFYSIFISKMDLKHKKVDFYLNSRKEFSCEFKIHSYDQFCIINYSDLYKKVDLLYNNGILTSN